MSKDDDKPPAGPGLKLEIFDTPQRALWMELGSTPAHFTLYGGTALALQLGHRRSVDFDFFSAGPFDPQYLLDTVPYLDGARVTLMTAGSLTATVDREGAVKVSFFSPTRPLTMIGEPVVSQSPKLRLASQIDIAATKLAVIAMRPASRDYIDIHALITQAGIPLVRQLAAVPFVFAGQPYNPYIPLKALAYFDDGDLSALPGKVKRELTVAVASTGIADVQRQIEFARDDPGFWKRL